MHETVRSGQDQWPRRYELSKEMLFSEPARFTFIRASSSVAIKDRQRPSSEGSESKKEIEVGKRL